MTYKARNKKTGQVYSLSEEQYKGYQADPFIREKYAFEPIPGVTPKVATPPEAKAAAKQA
jgi:hypothetical protein